MIARADQSDMVLWPLWFWALLGIAALAVLLLVLFLPKIAAPTEASPPVSAARASTNPECVRRMHAMAKVGGGIVWICLRDGCDETWLVMPERDPYDQAAAEVVAAAESLLRGAAS